ncbi:MAG TPA: hypothetical protein VLA04_00735 [Verrucomicrobiae bacterium]|nr:hypothetical protein [Verrucomicrobiae bacterium]
MRKGKEKSPHWDERQGKNSFSRADHPYREGFPQYPVDKTYTVIHCDGTRHHGATVDLDQQYTVEGKAWRTNTGSLIERYWVVAWMEE